MKLLCDECKTVWKIGLIGKAIINVLLANWKNYGILSNKVSQRSALSPVVFNIYIFDGRKCRKLLKFEGDNELEGAANIVENRIWIQNNLDKLKKESEINKMKFNVDKYHFWGRKLQIHKYGMENNKFGSSSQKKFST